MHLLSFDDHGEPSLTTFSDNVPPYAILSHTWGPNEEEVSFQDLKNGCGKDKAGYSKIQFCGKQARKDGLRFFWVDTCCINQANLTELSEAITSMFRWYSNAERCYVYMSDVSSNDDETNSTARRWKPAFRKSRWFTRAWTLQELIAPRSVEFFSREEELLGSKKTLELQINELTNIPLAALRGAPLSEFSVQERFQWADKRKAKKEEDKAYSLLGIFNVSMSLRYGEGNNAFTRLQNKAGIASKGLISKAYPVHWAVTRSVNTLFTGRNTILEDLEGIALDSVKNGSTGEPCWIVISGMGGQGKSELCLQLAWRLRHLFWGIFWVDASTMSSAENGFLNIGERFHSPSQKWEDARQKLANFKEPWLLVLDNADDVSIDYQQFFPSSSFGVVLLTSRNAECQHYATAKWINLEALPDAEARLLLLRAARVSHDQHEALTEDARVVTHLLRSHPLALIQAGSYVACGHCTLAQYPRVYERQRRRLLTFRPAQAQSRYGDIYATFEASAEALRSSDTESAVDALQLFPILAALHTSPLPITMFEVAWKGCREILQTGETESDCNENLNNLLPWHVSRLQPLISPEVNEWDSFRLVEAINLLKSLSLISTDITDGSFLCVSMHPLIHAWAKDRLGTIEQHHGWIAAGCLVALFSADLVAWQKHQRHLEPHMYALLMQDVSQIFATEPQLMVVRILMRCGFQLYKMRSDQRLFELMNNLLLHLGLDQMIVDPKHVEIYELKARNLKEIGKAEDAVILMKQVVKIREASLHESHQARLASQNVLARSYQAVGQVEEALKLMEHVVKINEQNLPENHRSRLASQHVLAITLRASGRTEEAVKLMEHVVKINEQNYAENHGDRLASQYSLAVIYRANGQASEAAKLMEWVVKINEQNLPEDHPILLGSQQELAMSYWDNGQKDKAVPLLVHVVKIRQQLLSEHHPDRVESERQLSLIKQELKVPCREID